MARTGEPSPLFDVIKRKKRKRDPFELPDWAKPKAEGDDTPVMKPASKAPQQEQEPSVDPRAWLMGTLVLRMPRLGACLIGLITLSLIIGAYTLGHEMALRNQTTTEENFTLQRLREQPVNHSLVPNTIERVARLDHPLPTPDGTFDDFSDPRKADLNYFRLTFLPSTHIEHGEKMIRFLRENSIDAAMIPMQNGESFKIVALKGFERPYSEQAKRYKDVLLKLGRIWKSQHRGGSDWHDMYPEKYTP